MTRFWAEPNHQSARYKALQVSLGIAVSALAVAVLLQQTTIEELATVLQRARPLPIVILIVLVFAGLLARTARWQVLFLPDRKLPFRPLLSTLTISYMASTLLPLRAGELMRAVFLAERAQLAIPRVMGTILLEKLFDFLAIAVLLLAVLSTTTLPAFAVAAGVVISFTIVLGFGFVVALAIWRAPTLTLVGWCDGRLPPALVRRVSLVRWVTDFAMGTDSLRVAQLWLPLLGWTALAWVVAPMAMLAGAAAIGLVVPLAVAAFVVVVGSTAMAVPSSPGYVGVYHATVVATLVPFGVGPADALGLAVIGHAFTYAPLVIAGVIAMWVDGYRFKDLRRGWAAR